MTCELKEEDLWSGLDRNAPEVQEHLNACPQCRDKAAAMMAGMSAVAQASSPALPPLPEQIGPYIIKDKLGEGGMGIVYEAEQPQTKRAVAIKVVRGGPHVDDYRVRLFQREAQTLARLRHPAIASIYDAGRTNDGQHYFAMELVHGQPLNKFVQANNTSRRARLALFVRICDAIHYAHLRGVIHRDLKPSNILVDEDGSPKILDFGLARISDPGTVGTGTGTELGRFMGTVPYMSPEEARGDPTEIDLRSDVYSLGVVLFELLTDRLPYKADKHALHEAVRTICEVSPRPLRSVDRTIDSDLETIAFKALEKDRGRRYQSAAALGEDLVRFRNNQPILARRAGFWYRFRKLLVRQQLFFILLAAILMTLSAAGVIVFQTLTELREAHELNAKLLNDRERVIERKYAEAQHTLALTHLRRGELDRADDLMRQALRALRNLGEDSLALRVSLDLAGSLIARVEKSSGSPVILPLMREAESLLLEALSSLDALPTARHDDYVEALRHLIRLYGPNLYDFPEGRTARQRELEMRRRARQGADVQHLDSASPTSVGQPRPMSEGGTDGGE